MKGANIVVFSLGVVPAYSRKIGTEDPLTEIVVIFLTLAGVGLLLLGCWMYLLEGGRMERISRWARQYLRRNEREVLGEEEASRRSRVDAMVVEGQKDERADSSAHHFGHDKKSSSIFRTQEVDSSKVDSEN